MRWIGSRRVMATLMLAVLCGSAQAAIDGITGNTTFNFTAREGYISTPEGGSLLVWGYANEAGPMQYPGPTVIVNEGDTLTFNLSNELDVPVSMVFPGQAGVDAWEVAAPTSQGVLALEVNPGGTVAYSFTASEPGTYHYHSGTRADLQIEMGLVGALIVRPVLAGQPVLDRAYDHPDSDFDVEFLFLETEMDPVIHGLVEAGRVDEVDMTRRYPVYWFLNGRCAPDTMYMPNVDWLPHQPYNCMPMMEPGQRMLLRVIGGGHDLHPLHHHGNHSRVIARDGRLLSTGGGAGANLGNLVFTVKTIPGETVDTVFTWTGAGLGWDIYGHAAGDAMEPGEYGPDHGKPFPVVLPQKQDLTFGGFWSGSPYMGTLGALPPGEGGMNPNAGYVYMWHSHTEKEMVNNDVFPGGMMTMLIIYPPGTMAMGGG